MTPLYEQMGLPSNNVYIREVNVSELPDDMQDEVGDLKSLFAVFAEDGSQIAIVDSPKNAFDLAKEHSFNLQQVH